MLTHRIFSVFKFLKPQQLFTFAQAKKAGPNILNDFSQIFNQTGKQKPTTGRPWKSQELRLKSNQDLHKLWFVCVKQKNILLADQIIQKRFGDSKNFKARILKVKKTMNRILGVVKQRQILKKKYKQKLENQYIQKKREQLRNKISQKQQQLPQITWQMLRDKYLELRRGVDGVKYLQKIWQQKQLNQGRRARMLQRIKTNKPKKFSSFWDYEMSIGERPLQQQVLRAHVRNWKSLNLKQRKIVLGFLNARRSNDAKASFLKQLKILGDKIAQDQIKSRIQNDKKQ